MTDHKSRLSVLQAIPDISTQYGGPANILRGVLPLLFDSNVECEVVTTSKEVGRSDGVKTQYDDHLRCVIHRFPQINRFGWYYAPGLQTWLHNNIARFDAAHIRSLYNYETLAVSRAAQAAKVPRLLETEGAVTAANRALKRYKKVPYLWLISRRNALRSEGFLVMHPNERADLLKLLPREHNTIYEVSAPVPVPKQPVEDIDNERNGILYLGRLHHQKGIELLMDIYKRIGRRLGPLRIAGSGSPAYEKALHAAARRLNLEEQIEFLGHLTGASKEHAFRQARLFVLPSLGENFSIAVVEAIGRGVPVVASDAVNAALTLAENGLARIFPVSDTAAATRVLEQAWLDTSWQRHATEKGPTFVRDNYHPTIHAKTLANHYHSLIAARTRT